MTGEKVRKDKHGGEGKKGEWRGREERTGEDRRKSRYSAKHTFTDNLD